MKVGEEIRPLRHTPGPDATRRYAEASGDHNPIHLDPEAARAAGLPRPILHGLYTMALVARCAGRAGDGKELRRLAVDFRALGFPAEEIEVSGVVEEVSASGLSLRLVARQGRRRLIRNASATLAE
ncbi:MAG TPA: MaoC family dehydratase [Solirubrobacterales bacterium]|nr:MaoC family dehydratase [Solirubrobacterales bacterium]